MSRGSFPLSLVCSFWRRFCSDLRSSFLLLLHPPAHVPTNLASTTMLSWPFHNRNATADEEERPPWICISVSSDAYGKDTAASTASTTRTSDGSFAKLALKLLFCFLGIQASFLTWGYMQELVMTTVFKPTPSAPDGKFPAASSGFLVLCNRTLSLLAAAIIVRIRRGYIWPSKANGAPAPIVAYAPCALSNTSSSWLQYASLAYVSFPVAAVFKCSKIIPVMIMGKFLQRKSYPWSLYLEALMISLGVAAFTVSSKINSHSSGNAMDDTSTKTQVIGLLLMSGYVICDAFTSQWQDHLYTKYGRSNIDSFQMMFGVSFWAVGTAIAGLLITNEFPTIVEFLRINPQVGIICGITAVCSTCGQLFIYYTIRECGPVVFTIIMTIRQVFSVILSSLAFHHYIDALAGCGAAVVFGTIFFQVYKKYRTAKKEEIAVRGTSAKNGGEEQKQVNVSKDAPKLV